MQTDTTLSRLYIMISHHNIESLIIAEQLYLHRIKVRVRVRARVRARVYGLGLRLRDSLGLRVKCNYIIRGVLRIG